MKHVKRCAICGKIFKTARPRQRTCGTMCSILLKGTYRVKKGTHKGVCRACGKPFVTNQHREYCNDVCRAIGNDKKVWETVPCARCGEPFSRSSKRKVYCDANDCYRLAKIDRDKERRSVH
jgi:hypothetical protein